MKKFNGLLKSEIRKAESVANKFFNRNDCEVTGFFTDSKVDEFNFLTVICEICFGTERADCDVKINVYLPDRRRSFARVIDY